MSARERSKFATRERSKFAMCQTFAVSERPAAREGWFACTVCVKADAEPVL